MELFIKILKEFEFTDAEVQEHARTIAKLIVVRFKKKLESELTAEEKRALPEGYLQFEHILDIATVPAEELRRKLALALGVVTIGIVAELVEASKKEIKLSDAQRSRVYSLLNTYFGI